jgi:DNA-binding NtrC family response regulator/tetratricopeptide (TPR) repeat protein
MYEPLESRPLSSEERERLLRCKQSSNGEEARRAEVILLSSEGKAASEIGTAVGMHPTNVKKWIRRFNQEGVIGILVKKRGPQGGPRPQFSRGQINAIVDLAAVEPRSLGFSFKAWTPQKLATAAIERGIVEGISHVTVRQILKRQSSIVEDARRNGDLKGNDHLEMGKADLSKARYESAAGHFRAALASDGLSADDEAIIRAMLSQALDELSRFDEAYDALSLYEDQQKLSVLSPSVRARVKLRLGWLYKSLRNYPKAIATLNESMKLSLEVQDDIGLSEVNFALGSTYVCINEYRIARDYLVNAVQAQKSVVDRELLARIYQEMGAVDFFEGAFSRAKEHYLKALNLADGSTNTILLGEILMNLGTACDEGLLGAWSEEGAEYERRAIEYLEQGEGKEVLALAYNNLAENLRCAGLWDEALAKLEKAIVLAMAYKRSDYGATARLTVAEILCARGGYAEAEEMLNRNFELLEGNPDKWLRGGTMRILASVKKGLGQVGEALKTLRGALALATSIGDLNGVALAQVGLAEIHYQEGRYDQAREYLEFASSRLQEENSLAISGQVQRLTGQVMAALGEEAEARQHLAQSISVFTTTAMPYEEARSHYELGLLLKRMKDRKGAEASLLKAKEIFVRLKASPYLKLTEDALQSLEEDERKHSPGIRTRVDLPSDLLLMQRLIDASASRDLLVQELASVVCENFPVSAIVIFRSEEGRRQQLIAFQGVSKSDAELFVQRVELPLSEKVMRVSDGWILEVGGASRHSIIIYVRTGSGFDLARLQMLLKPAELGLETCSLRVAARQSIAGLSEGRMHTVMPGFIVGSRMMFDVIDKIHKIRTNDVNVLITGESGTGKELVARAIHAESARARAVFLPFNCTATPKEIIDSQLFGHRRGAFTGATANYPGIIRAAEGGTLFLDEIGDLSLEVQPKLMRFLQEGEIQPLGETKPIRVDVRIIAATNTDLERAVEDGRFREDLFHRLNIIRIHVPPLRERREEIAFLAAHFLDHFAKRSGKNGLVLTQEGLDALSAYDWPGNVRQLRNEIERTVAYASEGAVIGAGDFSPEISHKRGQFGNGRYGIGSRNVRSDEISMHKGDSKRSFEEVVLSSLVGMKLKDATAKLERRMIEDSLVRNNYNLSRTAIDMGLSRRGLRLKLDQLGIERGIRERSVESGGKGLT